MLEVVQLWVGRWENIRLQERCVYISVLDNSLSRSSQCVVMDSGPGPVCETLRSEEGQNSEFKKNPNTGQVSVRLNQ